MPVVIDYNSPSAIGLLSKQAGQAQGAAEQAQLDQSDRNSQRQAIQALLGHVAQTQQGTDAVESQALRQGATGPSGQVIDNLTGSTWTPQGGHKGEGGAPAMQRYQASDGSEMPVTAGQKQALAQVDGNNSLDDAGKTYARNNILKQPNLTSYQLQNGQTVQVTPQQAGNLSTRQAGQAQRGDEFQQRMAAGAADREQKGQIAAQKVQALMAATQQRMDAAGSQLERQQIADETKLAIQGHTALVGQAKEHLDFAQSNFEKATTNLAAAQQSFNQQAVTDAQTKLDASKSSLEEKSNAYDAAVADMVKNVESHRTNLQAGKKLGTKADAGEAADPMAGKAVIAAKQMGAVKIDNDVDGAAYLKAAGAGQVATDADVLAARAKIGAGVDPAEARKLIINLLKAQGKTFLKSGTLLTDQE